MLDAWLRERNGPPEGPVFPAFVVADLAAMRSSVSITKYVNVAKTDLPVSQTQEGSLPMFFDTPQLWTFFNMASIAP